MNAPVPTRIPRWRVESLGLWTAADETDERIAIGWALQGERWPRDVEARHFYAPLHRRAACAVLLAGAWHGGVELLPLVRAMRRWRALDVAEAHELGEMYGEAQYVTEPAWDRLIERGEWRWRVLQLEAEAERMRRAAP